MFGLGTTELLVILVLVLVLFGAAKIPQLGRGLGEGIGGERADGGHEAPVLDVDLELQPAVRDGSARQAVEHETELVHAVDRNVEPRGDTAEHQPADRTVRRIVRPVERDPGGCRGRQACSAVSSMC